jgi:DNA-binding response OmpR family regulator
MKALVIDDDPDVHALVGHALQRAGYEVVSATDGERGLALLEAARPDIVLLDVTMPEPDGFEVCRRIRQTSQTPIVMLTARNAEEDVVHGFRVGADDYVTKPVSMRLLAARMATVLRRAKENQARRGDGKLSVDGLELDLQTMEARKGGREVHLTPLEFRILYMLAANPGRVVPYNRLIEYAWGREGGSPTHLKIRICNIRKKLGLPVDAEGGIRAVVGTGYTLRRAS